MIKVIYHGVEDFRTIDRDFACEKLKLDKTKDVVLFMGYLTGYKGLDLLIEGFSKYAKQNRNAFLIIGAGKHPKLKNDEKYLVEYSRLKNKAKELISKEQYKWVGFIDEEDITLYYSASDISLYPYTISMSSSGPMAMATGYEKPFLASDVFKKVLSKELIFKRTPEELSKKIESFFNNIEITQKKVKQMKKDRLWDNLGKNTYDIYRKLTKI